MDLATMGRGALIAGFSGAALLIIMFFSWFGVDVEEALPSALPDPITSQAAEVQGGIDSTLTAWQNLTFVDVVLFIAAALAIAWVGAEAAGASAGLPVAMSAITTLFGGLAFLLVLYRLIDPPNVLVGGTEVSTSRELGIWLGLVATGMLTYGGYVGMQETGTSLSEVRNRVRRGPPPDDYA